MIKKKIHYGWYIVACCATLTLGSTGIIYDCSGIFINPVSNDFGIGVSKLTFYLTISLLTRVFMLPIIGNIIERVNLKKLIISTVIIQSLTFMSMSTFTSVYQYYFAGIIYGITGSVSIFMFVPTILNNWFKDKLGFAIGIAMTFSSVGSIIFQPIGSNLINIFGWRIAYFILGASAALIVLPMMIFVLKEKPSDIRIEPYTVENKEDKSIETKEGKNIEENDGMMAKEAIKSSLFFLVIIVTICISYIGSMVYHTANFAISTGIAIAISGFVSSTTSLGLIVGKPILGYLNDKAGVIKATLIYAILGIIGLSFLLFSYTNYTLLFLVNFLLVYLCLY